MKPCKYALIEAAQKAKQDDCLHAILDELAPIRENPFMGMTLTQECLKQLLNAVYSQEYALTLYVNKQTWLNKATLSETIDNWYKQFNVVRLRAKPPVSSTLSFLRKYNDKPIKMAQVRYLLLKEAALPDVFKEYLYTNIPPEVQVKPKPNEPNPYNPYGKRATHQSINIKRKAHRSAV